MAIHRVKCAGWARQAQPSGSPTPELSARRVREQVQIEQVLAWIEQNLHEDIGWEGLMRISGLSPAQLQQLFQRRLKITPMTYIRIRREQAAGPR